MAASAGSWQRFLAFALSAAIAWTAPGSALADPAAGAGSRLLAQAPAGCLDAKAHFDVAKELGTREALQVHIDSYGDCPFAPFARMLMDKLPAAGAAAGDKAAEPAQASIEADRYAQRLAARLTDLRGLFGDDGKVTYERAEAFGADTKVFGLQILFDPLHAVETRLRFAETTLVRPVLSPSGSLSAERMVMTGGETSERNRGDETWVPALNPEGFKIALDSVALTAPAFLTAEDKAPDALGERVRIKALDVNGLRWTARDLPFLSLRTLAAGAETIEEGMPQRLTLKLDDASFGTKALTELGGTGDGLDQLGYDAYTFQFDGEARADPKARTLMIARASTQMDGGFGASVLLTLTDIKLSEVMDELVFGSQPGVDALSGVAVDFATIAYADSGLIERILALVAAESGVDATLLKAALPAEVQKAVAEKFQSPALGREALQAATEFMAAPKSLGLTFAPDEPVRLAALEEADSGADGTKAMLRLLKASVAVNSRTIDLAGTLEPALTAEQLQAIETCHRLAADSDDPRKLAPGVKDPAAVDAAAAIPACEAAHAASPDDMLIRFQLGRAYFAGKRLEDAVAAYEAAAAGGHPIADYELATAYLNGSGVGIDTAKAVEIFDKVKDEVPQARSMLASVNYNGLGGTPADPKRAISIWQTGVDKGEVDSEYNLGVELILGTSIAADPVKAKEYLTRAAEKGHADAMAELGKAYYRGDGGVAPDYETAYSWLAKAADAGSMIGRSNAGYMLALGVGTSERDNAKAAEWLLDALAAGDTDSAAYLIDQKGKNFDTAFRKAVQAALKTRGVYDGPTAGLFGRGTLDALKALRDGAKG